ncbi:MAG: glycosyltransferase, partial [Bryobacteraceae bacterium]|nr:glycosyltransferase [Bryobacteraceae bacterium]
AQTVQNFEVIIVDDGSRDGTAALLRRFAYADSRIKVFTQQNAGQAAALNAGLRHARTELIARIDADDVALPARLEKQIAYMRAHPDVVALGTGVRVIDSAGWPIGIEINLCDHAAIERQLLAGIGGALNSPSSMFRTAAVRLVGGWKPESASAQDLDVTLRLAEVGRLANLPDVLTQYRKHLSSANFAGRARMVQLARRVVEETAVRRNCQLPPFHLDNYQTKSAAGYHQEWAFQALQHGFRFSALKHAALAVLKSGASRERLQFFKYVVGRVLNGGAPVSAESAIAG